MSNASGSAGLLDGWGKSSGSILMWMVVPEPPFLSRRPPKGERCLPVEIGDSPTHSVPGMGYSDVVIGHGKADLPKSHHDELSSFAPPTTEHGDSLQLNGSRF